MDKEKLKKHAGYAGWGYVGGLVGELVILIIVEMDLVSGDMNPLRLILFGLVGCPGGWLAGVITKTWWRALVGGFILTVLIAIIGLLLVFYLLFGY